MLSRKRRNLIFIEALILTLTVYSLAIIVNQSLDNHRVIDFDYNIQNTQMHFKGLIMSEQFQKEFNITNCTYLKKHMFNNYQFLKNIGTDLSNYGQLFSKSNINLSYNRQREYFLDQLSLYIYVHNYNIKCENDEIIPILYFFDSLSTQLDTQSLLLEQFAIDNKNKTIIFSFDINYNREPMLNMIKNKYNINSAPYIVIGNFTTDNIGENGYISEERLYTAYLRTINSN